ncbi:MAG TPA: metallopeptidase TldD-related protein [Ramlibacter sp.]|uniref:metallopeptidase TldD-related protein n=1 Tax=Ramlibacter sp. TaxID=1917967 RepID=UPI002CB1BC67|nr:metallopeptidase TldD-related protein [Ramlibacter sp.]HVZ46472.1 metallopeptidase TldD-related protein [Ramlibacter sp.]
MNREYFEHLAEAVCTVPPGAQRASLHYAAESTDFIRFNQARVRQATHVEQHGATLSVAAGRRQATSTVTVTGHAGNDIAALLAERERLLADLALVPDDDHLLLPDTVESTSHDATGKLASSREVIEAATREAAGTDMVGCYWGGPVVRAFADSRGQRNWHRIESFQFEWCLYREADQAVKSSYAGTHWDDSVFASKMIAAREQLGLLALPRRELPPGSYRAYLSPVAVADLLATLAWGGFGLKDTKTGVSTLVRMHRGEARLHPSVALTEAVAEGIAPGFQVDGFVKPDAVPLVAGGRVAGNLVCARTAKEYGVQANGAQALEAPDSLAMDTGTLASADVLRALGTGVFISNLHYLNYSDRQACRMTGMTRFACFWVEAGRLVAPIGVMRFDDSFLRMFGEGLVALTSEAEAVPDNRTYGSRYLAGVTCPGAIVEGFRLTL